MHINLKLAKAKDIHLSKIISLQLLKQAKTSDVSEELENYCGAGGLQQLIEEGFVDLIKSKKNTTLFHLARLSKKGAALLNDLQTYNVEEEDILVFDWMKSLYLNLEKEIGSEKKTKELIAWFRTASGISKNSLILLLKTFVEDPERIEYSKLLQYVFWVPSHRYQKEPALEDSKLWLYYEKYKEKFDKMFEKYE